MYIYIPILMHSVNLLFSKTGYSVSPGYITICSRKYIIIIVYKCRTCYHCQISICSFSYECILYLLILYFISPLMEN